MKNLNKIKKTQMNSIFQGLSSMFLSGVRYQKKPHVFKSTHHQTKVSKSINQQSLTLEIFIQHMKQK